MKRHNRAIYAVIINIFICFALINTLNIDVLASDNTQDLLDLGKQLVKKYYIEDVSDSKLNEAKDMDSLIKSLGDPYSAYFNEKEYSDFTNSINNTFAGIGVQVEASTEGIKITTVFINSPAQESGLKTGDLITRVDGVSLAGLSTEKAITLIRGVEGSKVNLQIKRGEALLDFQVERRQIILPTVEGELIDNHTGYIRINTFGTNTSAEFKDQIDKYKNNSVDSYIIDLRNNTGGYMDVAFEIAGYFIGDDIVMKAYPKSGETITYNAVAQEVKLDKPIIFLINHYSASASEILSAAVKDRKKAFFIGEKTFGKGVAQSLFMMPGNNYLKLTTFRFVSPLGNEINKVGINPDIEVKDDFDKDIDSLKAARILLSGLTQSEEKNGTVKVSMAGRNFEIDMESAKGEELVSTFKYMAESLFNRDNFLFGNEKRWEKLPENAVVRDFLFKPEVQEKASNPSEGKVAVLNNEKTNTAVDVEVLPETGSAYDLYFYICLGIVFILAGISINNKERI